MKAFFKGIVHAFVSVVVVNAAGHIMSGQPITSGAVLIPSLLAGGLAVGHAIAPSIIGPAKPPTSSSSSIFPGTR